MVETVYKFSQSNKKTIEKVLFDENIHFIHVILGKDDRLPEHFSNSNVYMTVVRGTLSIGLDEHKINHYAANTMLKIPNNTKMNVHNTQDDSLELIIVKAPAPKM